MTPYPRGTAARMTLVALTLTTACGGEAKRSSSSAAATDSVPPAAAASVSTPATASSTNAVGEQVYARCATCHQPTGSGLPNVFPPLAGSSWVTGPVDRPIAILLHGLQGPITVSGVTYANAMMAYGTGAPLTDEEVAAVLTYVRSSFGNQASAVTAADVARVRTATANHAGPMTQADLEAIKN